MYRILHIPTGNFVWTIPGSSVFWIGEPDKYNKNISKIYINEKKAKEIIHKICYSSYYLLYSIEPCKSTFSGIIKQPMTNCVENEFEVMEFPDV